MPYKAPTTTRRIGNLIFYPPPIGDPFLPYTPPTLHTPLTYTQKPGAYPYHLIYIEISIHLPFYPPFHPSLYHHSIYPFDLLSALLFVYLSLYLSISLSIERGTTSRPRPLPPGGFCPAPRPVKKNVFCVDRNRAGWLC